MCLLPRNTQSLRKNRACLAAKCYNHDYLLSPTVSACLSFRRTFRLRSRVVFSAPADAAPVTRFVAPRLARGADQFRELDVASRADINLLRGVPDDLHIAPTFGHLRLHWRPSERARRSSATSHPAASSPGRTPPRASCIPRRPAGSRSPARHRSRCS